jgi:creatinine amidohydrolase
VALAWCHRVVDTLRKDGARAIVLPAVPYGLSHLTEGFAGRVTLQPGTLWALLDDLVTSLEQEGARRVVFASAHREPQHLRVLHGVALDHDGSTTKRARVVVMDSGCAFLDGHDETRTHGGEEETSMMLASDRDGVRWDVASALAPVIIDGKKIAAGYLEAGATQAYCGDPAAASEQKGAQLIETLVGATIETLARIWPDLST